ncbi:hypothetical protein [Paraburkholderia gardini]|uniref:Uncharacterized protein n=1 Tax=Paraburkholderia gardini TaxID=2823469 RepID=A0ABN7QSZ4_9BURK|nr:hypothetical protein [Paraburkholderia gardini]CAG4920303.1 hypothetical protein R54767_04700 [Paraburkholderia gardini]
MAYPTSHGIDGSPHYHGGYDAPQEEGPGGYLGGGRPVGKVGKDGLVERIHTEARTKRDFYEYGLPKGATKRSTWMGAFMREPELMMRISTNPSTNKAFAASWHRDHRADGTMIIPRNAQGALVLPELVLR